MKPGTVIFNNASIHIGYSGLAPPSQRGFMRELTDFYVPEHHRGKGDGTALLQSICDQADADKILLIIIADDNRLMTYYHRFGFDILPSTDVKFMARTPKKQSDAVKR